MSPLLFGNTILLPNLLNICVCSRRPSVSNYYGKLLLTLIDQRYFRKAAVEVNL